MAQPTYPHNIEKEYVYWVERNQIAIAYRKDTLTTGIDVVPAIEPQGEFLSPHKAVTIRIYAIKKAEVLTDREDAAGTAPSGKFILGELDDKPEFDEMHHEAILMYVLWKGYEKKSAVDISNLRMAQYFRKRYQECVQMAMRTASSNRIRGPRQVKYNKTLGIL